MKTFLLTLLLFAVNSISQEYPVEFKIDNLKNSEGNIIVSVYEDSKSFDEGMPLFRQTISKKENMNNGTFVGQLSIPKGVYGLVFLDDENGDGEMTNNLLGLPKEGFGFSNFYLSGFKKPKFSDFSFTHTENSEIIEVRLRYL